jgi:cytochrome b561
MTEAPLPGIQPARTTILGWLLAVSFLILFWNIIQMPRTALDQREFLRAFHYSLGLVVSILACVRLVWWFRGPRLIPPEGLPAASFAFHRAILLALLIVFAVESLLGFVYAWAIGEGVSLFGIPLPPILPKSEPARMASGYFHSALGFYYLMLLTLWFAYGYYLHFRYRAGIKRLFPGESV